MLWYDCRRCPAKFRSREGRRHHELTKHRLKDSQPVSASYVENYIRNERIRHRQLNHAASVKVNGDARLSRSSQRPSADRGRDRHQMRPRIYDDRASTSRQRISSRDSGQRPDGEVSSSASPRSALVPSSSRSGNLQEGSHRAVIPASSETQAESTHPTREVAGTAAQPTLVTAELSLVSASSSF